MKNKIHLLDSEQYYCVLSYYNDEFFPHDVINNVDISIFKIDEWNELLDISKIFEQSAQNFNKDDNNDLYYNKIRESTYFIYYNCPFCRFSCFTDLDYNLGNKQDIYERLFVEVRDKDKYSNVTINLFRNWIVKNLHDIKNHMKIIMD